MIINIIKETMSPRERKKIELQNEKISKLGAMIDYMSLMADVELPTEEFKEKEGMKHEA